MKRALPVAMLLFAGAAAAQPLPTPTPAPAGTPTYLPTVPKGIADLRDAALRDDYAWDIVEGLTVEVGQRMGGTEAEARARAWAVAKLKAMGFSNVRIERFAMPVWTRGPEGADILAPFPQKLAVTAFGNSASTPAQGVIGEIIAFDSLADLQAAPDSAVRGKIVFVSHAMPRTQDGSGYGFFGGPRRQGPSVASRKGAIAIVIRSIGTDYHRNPHTGVMTFGEGVRPIPAGALSIPDAEQPGRDRSLAPVLVGCHLDSWDLGTGAVDDAAGCGIVAAAAKRIMDAGRPQRSIRIVWFGAEEVGLFGGFAYREKHGKTPHYALIES